MNSFFKFPELYPFLRTTSITTIICTCLGSVVLNYVGNKSFGGTKQLFNLGFQEWALSEECIDGRQSKFATEVNGLVRVIGGYSFGASKNTIEGTCRRLYLEGDRLPMLKDYVFLKRGCVVSEK